jgi:hypothetical protein
MTVARRRPRVSFAGRIEEEPANVALRGRGKMEKNADIGDSGLSRGPIGDELDPDLEASPTVTELPRTNPEPSMPTSITRHEIEEIPSQSQNSDAGIISNYHNLKRSWYGRRV